MGKKVQVLDTETGTVYESKAKAFLATGISWHKILTHKLPNGNPKFITVEGAFNPHNPYISEKSLNNTIINTGNIQFQISLIIKKQQEKPKTHFFPNKDIGREVWNLETMNLAQECSDFYVLYDLTIDHSDDTFMMAMFNNKRDYLAQQFSNYLDMVIGGELRHCKNLSIFFGKIDSFHPNINKDRHQIWGEWKEFRNQRGIDAVKIAFRAFDKGCWFDGYGGKTWAKATQVLLRFLAGKDSKIMFVDTVWSLQHNTTYILNKFWNIDRLAPILDRKFNGQIKDLVLQNKCSPEVAQIYKELNHLA